MDIKKLITGKKKPVTVNGSRYPNGTQSLVPVADIRQGVIITADGRYIKLLEVLPTNFYLKSETEQANIIYCMAGYLKIAPDSLQFIVKTRGADIDAYCDGLEECYNREKNETLRSLIYEEAQLVNYLAENEAVTRKFYIAFAYEGSSSDFDEIAAELNETAETAYRYLDYCGLEVLRHGDYNAFLFAALFSFFRSGEDYRPVWEDLKNTAEIGDLTVCDALAPTTAELERKDYIITDGLYRSYLYVCSYGYPSAVPAAWLSPLTELGDGISVSFYIDKKPKEQILQKVSKTTMFNRTRLKDAEDTRTDYERMDDAVNAGMYIKEQLNREGEDFYYMHTLIEVTAPDAESLESRIKQVKNRCGSLNMTIRRADYCHEKCFISMLPLCGLDRDTERRTRRNILTEGAAAAFPFSSFELCDSRGILLGLNLHNNSAVIIDSFNSDIYSNGNMAIFGMSGAGKTYAILLLAMRLRMTGVQVFVIAPEKGFEYRGICEALGGQYIKIARGSSDCINIMDIRRTTLDIDDNLINHQSRQDSVMLDVVQDIKTYLKLRCPEMTPEQSYILGAAVIDCYRDFGITRDNASLLEADGSFKKMPCLEDLYLKICDKPELKSIAVIIKDLAAGGMAGRTNVDLKSDFIVLDTSGARDEDLSAATFMATVFIRDEISRSRTDKKAVFGDELWIIAGNEGNEQAADFVIKLVKTIRGYGGIFVSATQNATDYFALGSGRFGDAVLNNSRLKLLLQMEEPEAVKLKEKIGLTDEEVMQIIRCGRGQGLLCAGKNRIAVEIRSTETEYELITTDREALGKRAKK